MTVHAWTLVMLRVGAWILVGALAGVVLWGVWDLVLIARGQLPGNSISQAAMRQLYAWPPVVLAAFGALAGILVGTLLAHFGWVAGPPRELHPGIAILAGLVLGLAVGVFAGRLGWILPAMRRGA